MGDGYEGSKARAVERALDLAGGNAEWIAGRYARAYYHGTVSRKEAGGKAGSAGASAAAALPEFLYRDTRDALTGRWRSVPHRVVRRTAYYVYVEQHPHAADVPAAGWPGGRGATFRLDRQMLEREGFAFIPPGSPIEQDEDPAFFASPQEERALEAPECLQALGLPWPCTADEVRTAYRRLARRAHPDGGGSHDAFLALQAAYEQALHLCCEE